MTKRTTAISAIVIGAVCVSLANGQTGGRPDYQNVTINARSGRVSARAPGNMVRSGLSRAREFSQRAFAGTQIDREASDVPPDPWSQARIQSLQIMFTSVNVLINSFQNSIRAKAGLDPVPPILPDFSSDSGGTGGLDGNLDGFDLNDLLDSLGDFLGGRAQ